MPQLRSATTGKGGALAQKGLKLGSNFPDNVFSSPRLWSSTQLASVHAEVIVVAAAVARAVGRQLRPTLPCLRRMFAGVVAAVAAAAVGTRLVRRGVSAVAFLTILPTWIAVAALTPVEDVARVPEMNRPSVRHTVTATHAPGP